MNILPKKKWHVRTKENVARVLKDEENARIEHEKEQQRISKAESEARISLLRHNAAVKYSNDDPGTKREHVNFFSTNDSKGYSKESVEEKDTEQKKWEMKVGLLKRLGEGSSELADEKPWYQKSQSIENKTKRKSSFNHIDLLDPLSEMRKRSKTDYKMKPPDHPETVYVDIDFKDKVLEYSEKRRKYGCIDPTAGKNKKDFKKNKKHHNKKKKKHKRHHDSDSSSDTPVKEAPKKSIQRMREERLQREEVEKLKSKKLLNPHDNSLDIDSVKDQIKPKMKQKYNSQFNPSFVRSNYKSHR